MKDSISEQVAKAIMGDISQETVSARVSCNTVSSTAIQCICGNILDERDITVVRVRSPLKRATQGFCSSCWATVQSQVLPALRESGFPFTVENWDGLQESHRPQDLD